MAHLGPLLVDALGTDWCAIQNATGRRVSRQRINSATSSWLRWDAFCASLGIDSSNLPADPVPVLQVFTQRLRTGALSPHAHPVRSRTVEDTVPDPRMNVHGHLDFCLTSLYQVWLKVDDPPSRVKQLPLGLFHQTVQLALTENTPAALAAADCLVIGYFFLLCPGEYIGLPVEATDTLFRVRDLQLWIGSRALAIFDCTVPELQAATFATLTFTRQKNGVRKETVGHGRSSHPVLCPVLCLVSRVVALRLLHASPSTSLNAHRESTPDRPFQYVLPFDITHRLRAVLAIYPDPAIAPGDISARPMRAGGAMALLCTDVDRDRIKLVGRWRSEELYRYLHVQAQPVMAGLAALMLRNGSSFRLTPG